MVHEVMEDKGLSIIIYTIYRWLPNDARSQGICDHSIGLGNRSATHRWVHDDVIWWKHFPRYWPFVREIHRPSGNSHQKGQWRGALMFSLICAWINSWVKDREAGDLRRHQTEAQYQYKIPVKYADIQRCEYQSSCIIYLYGAWVKCYFM